MLSCPKDDRCAMPYEMCCMRDAIMYSVLQEHHASDIRSLCFSSFSFLSFAWNISCVENCQTSWNRGTGCEVHFWDKEEQLAMIRRWWRSSRKEGSVSKSIQTLGKRFPKGFSFKLLFIGYLKGVICKKISIVQGC